MTVSTTKTDHKLTISVGGKLNSLNASELENAVKQNTDGISELVFDLSELEYIASAGLRVFILTYKLMRKQGSVRIINAQPFVKDVFRLSGLSGIIEIEAM